MAFEAVPISDPLMFNPNTQLGAANQGQVDAVKAVLGLGTTALAFGAGARGLSGLGNFINRNTGGDTKKPMRESFVRIPVPVKVKTRAERDAMLAQAARAQAGYDKEAGLVKLAEEALAHAVDAMGLLRRPNQDVGFLHNQLAGWGQHGMWNKPWVPVTALGAIGGGLYGGWKLTDYLLNKTKDIEQESELDEAKQDYEEALAGRSKIAAAGPSPLDTLADMYEKRGDLWDTVKGVGLAGAGVTALLSGMGTYNWARSVAQDKAVEEAVKRRQAQITEQSPSPIMAIPTPVPIYEPRRSAWRRAEGGLAGLGRGLEDVGTGVGAGLGRLRERLTQAPEPTPSAAKPKRRRKGGEKVANVGQAADQFLDRIKNNQMAVWQRLMTPADAKPARPPAGSDKPAPPQLPTLAGTGTRMMNQPAAAGAR